MSWYIKLAFLTCFIVNFSYFHKIRHSKNFTAITQILFTELLLFYNLIFFKLHNSSNVKLLPGRTFVSATVDNWWLKSASNTNSCWMNWIRFYWPVTLESNLQSYMLNSSLILLYLHFLVQKQNIYIFCGIYSYYKELLQW